MPKIEFINQSELEIDLSLVKKISTKLTRRDIELLLVDNSTIKELNKTFRLKDEPTDVLSFPLQNLSKSPLGSIVISSEFVIQKAQELHHSYDDEFGLLFIHGLLHLLGYDHEIDNGEMRQKEEELIRLFNLPKSLIVRSEE